MIVLESPREELPRLRASWCGDAKALAALTEAARRHDKPSPLIHDLLALVSLAMDQQDKAQAYLKQAQPAKDAPWEEVALHRLLQAEVEAALVKADAGQPKH